MRRKIKIHIFKTIVILFTVVRKDCFTSYKITKYIKITCAKLIKTILYKRSTIVNAYKLNSHCVWLILVCDAFIYSQGFFSNKEEKGGERKESRFALSPSSHP